jgi:type IV secretory pathway VirB9-like protein
MKYLLALIFASVTLLAAETEIVKPLAAQPAPAASVQPVSSTAPPRIDDPRTVVIGERSVTPIYVCQFQETLLILPTAEKVMKSFVADTVNWKLESGHDDQASRYISIKVREPQSPQTTLNVISDKESNFTFRLILNTEHCDSKVSIEGDSQMEAKASVVQPWVSPAEAARLHREIEEAQTAAKAAKAKSEADTSMYRSQYPTKLRFDYHFNAKAAEKLGVQQIFHDDKFTYVVAHPQETPALFELKEGKPSLITFDFHDGLYTAGKIVTDGYLAVGGNGNGKHQKKLEFHKTEAN